MTDQEKTPSAGKSGSLRPGNGELRKLGNSCSDAVEKFLRARMDGLFQDVENVLFERAKTMAGDRLEASYFDAIQSLRRFREMISEAFIALLEDSVTEFWTRISDFSTSADVLDADNGSLALMQDDDLEENIAVSNIVSRAEAGNKQALRALDLRLSALATRSTGAELVNPVCPQEIAEAFRESLTLWKGEMVIRLTIYKLFESNVTEQLGELYTHLNDQLIAAGVLPDLVAEVESPEPAASSASEEAASQSRAADLAELIKPGDEITIFGLVTVLRNLLHSQRDSLGLPDNPTAEQAQGKTVEAGELAESLRSMQMRFSSTPATDIESAHDSSIEFRKGFSDFLSGGRGESARHLHSLDQHVIDVVMMLFDFVLDDPLMPDAMKVLLSRLQIPMLRVAVSDRSFLSNKQHPARSLLNNLARTGVHWTDDGERSAGSLYGKVESAVNRVLSEFSGEVSVFAAIDREFQLSVDRETAGARVAEERLSQVARGQEQLNLARKKVSELLAHDMTEQLPVAAYNILDDGWRDVMTLILLREGESSREWKKAVSVVHRLVDSVIPRSEAWQRQKIMRDIPMLIADLREGFASVSYDAQKTARLFKQLQLCHINALRGQSTRTIGEEFPDGTYLRDSQLDSEELQDQYSEMAGEVELGQWLAWQDQQGKELRGKLSWRSELTDALLIVDNRGRKVAEMRNGELAALFRDGRARLLDHLEVPLLDRALHSMLDVLRGVSRDGGTVLPA